jgi:hypothetical protein
MYRRVSNKPCGVPEGRKKAGTLPTKVTSASRVYSVGWHTHSRKIVAEPMQKSDLSSARLSPRAHNTRGTRMLPYSATFAPKRVK